MKDVYADLYLEKSITALYMAKEQFLEYSIESIKKDDNNPRISQCYKNEAIDLYQHNISEKEQTHNEIITFVLSGYNTPFCVHADPYKGRSINKCSSF